MVDIYDRARGYERLKARLDEWPIRRETRDQIRRYLRNMIDRRSPGRRYADLCFLKRIFVGTTQGRQPVAPLITKALKDLSLEDCERIRERCDAEVTSKDHYDKLTGHVRNLYEDVFGDDPRKRPLIDVLFRTGRRRFFQWRSDTPTTDVIDQSKYYTYEEFTSILRVAQRPRDRALLALAWETTARPNEYLTLTVGDVEELAQGFKIRAHISKRKGRAPYRFLYIFSFSADFNAFWRCHAFRDDPRAPLFYRDDNTRDRGRALSGAGANKMLKGLDRLSGVRKNGTLYFLRHGGYTWKRLLGMNPALAGKDMGWVPGGKEERRYLHLTDEEVMGERLRLATGQGLSPEQREVRAPVCPSCGATNSPVDSRCAACGSTLDRREFTAEAERLRQEHTHLLDAQLHGYASELGFELDDSGPRPGVVGGPALPVASRGASRPGTRPPS